MRGASVFAVTYSSRATHIPRPLLCTYFRYAPVHFFLFLTQRRCATSSRMTKANRDYIRERQNAAAGAKAALQRRASRRMCVRLSIFCCSYHFPARSPLLLTDASGGSFKGTNRHASIERSTGVAPCHRPLHFTAPKATIKSKARL